MSAVKILVTTDGSNLSDKAVDTAIGLAEQVGGSVVGMTAVLTPAPAGGFEDEDPVVKECLEAISRKAAEAEVPCEVIAEHAETVAQGVLACAAVLSAHCCWAVRRRKCSARRIVRC